MPDNNLSSDPIMEAIDYSSVDEFVAGAYILTVDDFSVIRRIIVNTLRAKEAYVDEAANGSIALDKIRMAYENNVPYDLIFLDIEMPVLDGVGFLQRLRKDPELSDTPVIVLSSHSDKAEISQCISYGISDYIIKPITKDRLYHAVSKSLSGHRKGVSHGAAQAARNSTTEDAGPNYAKIIFQKLESIENLPTLPVILDKIKELTKDPTSNNERIAAIMEDDPAMMANVLKLANSAMYGAKERIESLQGAITRLGLNAVYNMASSMAVLNVMNTSKSEGFDHKEFCRHAITTGIAMSVIYDDCQDHLKTEFSSDFLHLTGLLHDIGKIIIIQFFKDEFTKSIMLSKKHSIPLFAAEQKALGVDHTEVGAWLAKKWTLANEQIDAISYHHSPMMTEIENKELVMLCHAANYVCNLQKLGNGGDALTPLFDQRVFDQLGFSMQRIPEIINKVTVEAQHSEILMQMLK